MVQQERILWCSVHPLLPLQKNELKRLFGEDAVIEEDAKKFHNVDDIVERIRRGGFTQLAFVGPLSVVIRLCKRGIRPLYAQMKEANGQDYDVMYRGRYKKFLGWKRIENIHIEFSEIVPKNNKVK